MIKVKGKEFNLLDFLFSCYFSSLYLLITKWKEIKNEGMGEIFEAYRSFWNKNQQVPKQATSSSIHVRGKTRLSCGFSLLLFRFFPLSSASKEKKRYSQKRKTTKFSELNHTNFGEDRMRNRIGWNVRKTTEYGYLHVYKWTFRIDRRKEEA